MIEAEQIMKRCQAGTRNYEEANNLHAACYGMIGKLLAQRTWVGLTDEEIGDEYVRFEVSKGGFNRFEYAVRAIEAKLKELNDHSI